MQSSPNLKATMEEPGDASSPTPLHRTGEEGHAISGPDPPRPFHRSFRTPIGNQRSCNARFKSPVPAPRPSPLADVETLRRQIQELRRKESALDGEIAELSAEGYRLDELDTHISLLHEYNEMKDTGQMLLGRLAVLRGITTKELYPEFGLDIND